jgi:hypothetical protein
MIWRRIQNSGQPFLLIRIAIQNCQLYLLTIFYLPSKIRAKIRTLIEVSPQSVVGMSLANWPSEIRDVIKSFPNWISASRKQNQF